MIDFHSHILPGIDDGSRNVEESVSLLKMLAEQGITTAVATPHFYAERQSLESFIQRRDKAYERISESIEDGFPNIILGAEVRYYTGISQLEDLHRLCIENTNLLLLEMPMIKWTEYTVGELTELSSRGDMTIVLAHVERCIGMQSSREINELHNSGVLMQCNADYFLSFSTKRKAISMLRRGEISFLGSDCHNLTSRPPRIGEAYRIIGKKLGTDFLKEFDDYGKKVLEIK